MLSDEKLIKRIKDYDKNFENNNEYVYACIEGGLNKSKYRIIWIVLLIILFVIFDEVTDNIVINCAIIGGLIGASAAAMNDFCVIQSNDKFLKLYIFNKLGTKIINKLELYYNEMEMEIIKKKSIWSTIKIKTQSKKIKIVISKKTIGLKSQTENSEKLIEELERKIAGVN